MSRSTHVLHLLGQSSAVLLHGEPNIGFSLLHLLFLFTHSVQERVGLFRFLLSPLSSLSSGGNELDNGEDALAAILVLISILLFR